MLVKVDLEVAVDVVLVWVTVDVVFVECVVDVVTSCAENKQNRTVFSQLSKIFEIEFRKINILHFEGHLIVQSKYVFFYSILEYDLGSSIIYDGPV